MGRSEKMEKEVAGELERSGCSAQEAQERVRGMRTGELVKSYYYPSSIKSKSIENKDNVGRSSKSFDDMVRSIRK